MDSQRRCPYCRCRDQPGVVVTNHGLPGDPAGRDGTTAPLADAASRGRGVGGWLVLLVGPVFSARTWLVMVYLLSGLPVSVLTFTLAVTGTTLAVGLMPLALLGLPVLAAALLMCGGFAAVERARVAGLLDVVLPVPQYKPASGRLPWQRAASVITDSQRWKQVAGAVLMLPVSVVGLSVAISWWAVGLGLVTIPLYNSALPRGGASAFGWVLRGAPGLSVAVLIGALLLQGAPHVSAAVASAQVSLDRLLLGASRQRSLAARVDELQLSRSRMVVAADSDRRRLERDLHDGAQARLVSLAMDLGRARARFDHDPEAAKALVEEAHEQAKTALAELRNLVRGVHPPVLSDRGLDAALSGLAALCPVPVTVQVEMGQRPSQTVEAIAYFVVAEALTNVAKHSGAARATVTVRSDGKTLRVLVQDDGRGGARPDGPGLSGLADRARAVDGGLWVTSPLGGPTVIEAELPCES